MGKEAKDILHYLNPEQQRIIDGWARHILPLIEKHPGIKDVDLVIEGGVGTGITLKDITRRLFPDALYVGTEIGEYLFIGQPRMRQAIDEKVLDRVKEANGQPSFGMKDALIHGNCFDAQLIRDIAQKTGRRNPMLATFNALYSLLARKTSLYGDRKDRSDRIELEDMVSSESPYMAQLHIGVNGLWQDIGTTSLSEPFYGLETAAKSAGWRTERFNTGLLLLRPQLKGIS